MATAPAAIQPWTRRVRRRPASRTWVASVARGVPLARDVELSVRMVDGDRLGTV